jgi:hypothetical protein
MSQKAKFSRESEITLSGFTDASHANPDSFCKIDIGVDHKNGRVTIIARDDGSADRKSSQVGIYEVDHDSFVRDLRWLLARMEKIERIGAEG